MDKFLYQTNKYKYDMNPKFLGHLVFSGTTSYNSNLYITFYIYYNIYKM